MATEGGSEERPPPKSFGNISEHHWSRARRGMNEEALEHYRKRSRAPGVAAGGGPRNHYCLECNGVLPLAYDSRHPAAGPPEVCPHCGARLDPRVRAMFNWVETDQVPSSDLRALAPWFIGGFAVLAGGVWAVVHWLL